MSVASILEAKNPAGSLARFVLDIYDGVIEGDARAARERIVAYREFLKVVGLDGENADPQEMVKALLEALEAGAIPAPLANKGTVITGRFSAQTEWRAEAELGVSLGIGAVPLNLSVSASYGRQQAESSEFTIYLEPVNSESMFGALAGMISNTEREKALPEVEAETQPS